MKVSLVIAALGVALASPARAQESGIEVGAVAPPAVVQTLDGKSIDLARWVGKTPVIMEFWAIWCSNCQQLEPHLKTLHAKYGKQVRFLTVAVSINQNPDRVKRYAARHKIPGDIVFDAKGNASGAYDVAATSYVVVVDRAGKVIYTGLGGSQPKLEAAIARAAKS